MLLVVCLFFPSVVRSNSSADFWLRIEILCGYRVLHILYKCPLTVWACSCGRKIIVDKWMVTVKIFKLWANWKHCRKHYVSYQCFPVCLTQMAGNIVGETKFASQEKKCFPTNSETFLLRKQCFLVCPHANCHAGHFRSIFSHLCGLLLSADNPQKIFSRLWSVKISILWKKSAGKFETTYWEKTKLKWPEWTAGKFATAVEKYCWRLNTKCN